MKNKKFTKDDLKVGYVVKMRDGSLNMVMPNNNDELITVDASGGWMYLKRYNDCLFNSCNDLLVSNTSNFDIMEVYGRAKPNNETLKLDISDRDLLWKREEAKKMTVEEIEKELGYKIEIVS